MTKLSKFAAIALVLLGILLAIMAVLSQRANKTPDMLSAVGVMPTSQVQVAVAKQDMPAGHLISESDVVLESMAQMPNTASSSVQAVVGRVTAVEVAQGMPLLTSNFVDGIAGLLQPGERAVSIKIEEFSSVGHKVRPGDWVDVFAVMRKDAAEVDDTQARLLLLRKKVLAFGAQLHPAAQSQSEQTEEAQRKAVETAARTAVIAVQVEEVNRLILAEQQGQVLLALRSPLDNSEPSAEVLQQTAVWRSPEAETDPVLSRSQALDASLAALTLSSLTEVAPSKAVTPAPAAVLKASTNTQRVARRTNSVRSDSGTAVEVVRGTRSETVRY